MRHLTERFNKFLDLLKGFRKQCFLKRKIIEEFEKILFIGKIIMDAAQKIFKRT